MFIWDQIFKSAQSKSTCRTAALNSKIFTVAFYYAADDCSEGYSCISHMISTSICYRNFSGRTSALAHCELPFKLSRFSRKDGRARSTEPLFWNGKKITFKFEYDRIFKQKPKSRPNSFLFLRKSLSLLSSSVFHFSYFSLLLFFVSCFVPFRITFHFSLFQVSFFFLLVLVFHKQKLILKPIKFKRKLLVVS